MNISTMLRRVALAAVALPLFAAVASAQAKIDVVGGETYDWGTVAPGKLHAAIKITNIGDGTLNIDTVRVSCGCTAAPIDKKVLNPGDTATVNVTLDVTTRTGQVEKSITVVSDDAKTPYRFVILKANIRRTLQVVPMSYFVVSNAKKGEQKSADQEIRIVNTGDDPFTVYPPELKNGNIDVVFSLTSETVVKPGEELKLTAQVTPKDDRFLYGNYTVRTTNPDNPTVDINVTGTMAPLAQPQGAAGAASGSPQH